MDVQDHFKAVCDNLRKECHVIETGVRSLTGGVSELPEGVEFQEVNANLMLAVRHLEDARMRLGKAIQWGCQDGVSCFDKKPNVSINMSYENRVIAEKKELDQRLAKLSAFIESDSFNAFTNEYRSLLCNQETCMRQYSAVLGQRICAFSGAPK